MYSPRNGTIRGPGSASERTASRSDWSPAQTTSRSTVSEPAVVVTLIRPPARSMPVTAVDSRTWPPAASISPAIVRAIATKSVIAVSGECSAASPVACGSMSVMPAASTRASPGTPFARAVCSKASNRPSSFGSTATTSLPHWSNGSPCSAQYSLIRARPRVQSWALRLPGL